MVAVGLVLHLVAAAGTLPGPLAAAPIPLAPHPAPASPAVPAAVSIERAWSSSAGLVLLVDAALVGLTYATAARGRLRVQRGGRARRGDRRRGSHGRRARGAREGRAAARGGWASLAALGVHAVTLVAAGAFASDERYGVAVATLAVGELGLMPLAAAELLGAGSAPAPRGSPALAALPVRDPALQR